GVHIGRVSRHLNHYLNAAFAALRAAKEIAMSAMLMMATDTTKSRKSVGLWRSITLNDPHAAAFGPTPRFLSRLATRAYGFNDSSRASRNWFMFAKNASSRSARHRKKADVEGQFAGSKRRKSRRTQSSNAVLAKRTWGVRFRR